jgi:hypothetical protein
MQLVEESVELLRSAPAQAWAVYLAGAVPFAVALLWYWIETTHSAFALENLAHTSAVVAVLFLWKQITEAYFLAVLRARLTGESPHAPRPNRVASVAIRQAAIQPTSFLILPLATLATVPLPYALTFYRHFSLASLDGGESAIGRAWNAARAETRAVWILLGVLTLGALLLYVNLVVAVIAIAQLAGSFFGVESVGTSPMALVRNTAVHFAVLLAVYLAVDLLLDAAAVLQWFYSRSVRSGDDLLARLRRAPAIAAAAAFLLFPAPLAAQQPGVEALDTAIERTLRSPEFAWRTAPPQEDAPPFVRSVATLLRKTGEIVDKVVDAILKWLEPESGARPGGRTQQGGAQVRYWMIALAALAAALLIAILLRFRRPPKPLDADPESAPQPVDVRDEAVMASALPEDEWLRMADDYLARGELRVALRALHLGCLRMLSERGMLSIARWKTGMEYFDEVRRRSRHVEPLARRFRENVGLFEIGWYSRREVDLPMVEAYRRGLEEIRSHG